MSVVHGWNNLERFDDYIRGLNDTYLVVAGVCVMLFAFMFSAYRFVLVVEVESICGFS